jgi:hypothetical protein
MTPNITPTAIEYAVRIIATPDEKMTKFEIWTLLLSALAFLISFGTLWVTIVYANRPYNLMRTHLYTKCRQIFNNLNDFIKETDIEYNAIPKERRESPTSILCFRFDPKLIDYFNFTQEEQHEFSQMDIDLNVTTPICSLIPKRIQDWYSQETTTIRTFTNEYSTIGIVINSQDYNSLLTEAITLTKYMTESMIRIRKTLSFPTRVRFWITEKRNKDIQIARLDEIVEFLKKQSKRPEIH